MQKCIRKINSLMDIINLQGNNVSQIITEQYKKEFPNIPGMEHDSILDGYISLDQDLKTFFNSIGVTMNGKRDTTYIHPSIEKMTPEHYCFLYDGQTGCYVEIKYLPNIHDDDLGEETFLNFNNVFLVNPEILDHCDECNIVVPRDVLFNLNPDLNDDLKEEYRHIDGMVCINCYNKVKK